ncbi:hypothetical protein EDF56_10373 [Novosphingobium sp. PhB165]|uniref:hypothetical protein n=1 Tax=Novosphingobium sp. PhB165 TaxID=2485105 RepID=UPI001042EC8D|nr:hypothetical protein [Novosphingobium sp. PhB165]TCM19437.1 hypothetical protein EDF56_10373 [Novosphingobium sp. PhB165]
MYTRTTVLIAASLLMAGPAFAADPATAPVPAQAAIPAATPAAAPAAPGAAKPVSAIDANDPVICQRQQEIGSLLKVKKVCMTKSQWAEQRQINRSNIEQSQVQRGLTPAQ